MNVIPKFLGLLSNTINWIECHMDIGFAKCQSATSSTATKFAALEGLTRDEEPVLD
jgi:hypothetical protein